jgi:nicotinamidase-related amidase
MRDAMSELADIVNPTHSAVLVIDMQNDFCSPKGAVAVSGVDVSMMEGLVSRIVDFLAEARSRAIPVVFVKVVQSLVGDTVSPSYLQLLRRTMLRRSSAGAMFGIDGTWGAEILNELQRRPNEPVIVKHRSSAFVGTTLHELLQSFGVQTVVIVGEQSCGCVEATIRQAADLDYYPVVVRDCTTSYDPDLHEAAILTMSRRWWAPSASEVLSAWEAGVGSQPRATNLPAKVS